MDIEIKKVEAKARKLKEPNNIKQKTLKDKHAGEYYSDHMVSFEQFNRLGWKSINVLEFLNGKTWDDLALGYVHALRPSSIRVTKGGITLDARVWRVTVHINEDKTIKSIQQEVEVGLPETVAHGEAMRAALAHGLNSPQCQWYNDDTIEGYVYAADGYFKRTKNGLVKFPEEEDPFDYAGKILDKLT